MGFYFGGRMQENIPNRKFKRRFNLLIYPKFQLGLVAVNLALMGAAFGFVILMVGRVMGNLRARGEAAKLAADHVYFRFLDMQVDALYSYILVAFAVGGVLSTVATLLLSQRLAGPIVRLRGYFREILQSGKAPQYDIKFRRGDFFSDLPAVINGAFEALKGGAGKSNEEKDRLKKAA